MNHYSPLRYPGGKGKLAKFIKQIIKQNNLLDGTYIEPFAGGASIGIDLLFNEYVSRIAINDIDRSIHALWYSILNFTDEFCSLIKQTPITVEEWLKQRELLNNQDEQSELTLGFAMFFLNRTNRSGIIKGGPIGGFSQEGKWKIDARFNRIGLVERVQTIARYKDRISLYNLDAEQFIRDVISQVSGKCLIYLDPPYYNKGNQLYVNYYDTQDHSRLAQVISSEIDQNWIVTYDNTPEISDLYSDFRQTTYSLSYSVSKRCIGSEIMVFSDSLVIPDGPVSSVNAG